MSKPLQLGRSASDGLVAAQLAKEGFSGPGTLLDSDPGFGRPFVGEAIVDFDALDREWGRPYALLRNSFKPHASCMITHPIIDAASLLRNDLQSAGVEWDQLSAIECHVNPLAPHVAGNPRPATGLEGKFSVAYCCLLGLIDGSATPDKFSAAALGRSAIRESLPRVSVRTNADIGEQQAKVVVTTREGDVMAREVAMAKGNPANPMTDDELGDKFIALVEPVLGPSTRPALRHLWDFEKESDACAWFAGVMKTGMAA
jgi:2-methylcitrate dehydratase PrpD